MPGMFSGILQLVMAVILVTAVLIPQLKATCTTGWSVSEIAVFGLASLVSIFGLVNGIANLFGLGY
jgi:hypothetical protein